MVSVADKGPEPAGVNFTSNGKQEPGLIVTGYPDEGLVTPTWGLDEVMRSTKRSVFPVLHTLSVAVLVLPTQESPKATVPGIWICGTQQTIVDEKKASMSPEGGVMEAGDLADAQLVYNRPAPQALPL